MPGIGTDTGTGCTGVITRLAAVLTRQNVQSSCNTFELLKVCLLSPAIFIWDRDYIRGLTL